MHTFLIQVFIFVYLLPVIAHKIVTHSYGRTFEMGEHSPQKS